MEWIWRITREPKLARRYWADALSLGWLLSSEVAPRALSIWVGRLVQTVYPSRPRISSTEEADRVLVRLGGRLADTHLDQLQTTFAAAITSGKPITLDLAGIVSASSEVRGAVLRLRREASRRSRPLHLIGARHGIQRSLAPDTELVR
jgi:N-acetylglucosaminyldiphosphoundecaprenol N-acetyl-beta-D-mannosaminyltransferase